jgi:SAM-dependent methyltransferase
MIFFWTVWGLALLLVLVFGAVILIGAPYMPTLGQQRQVALDLLDLKKGQTFIDLGCGDGSMLSAAAKRGLKAVGYEINPFLAAISWVRTRRYGRQIKVVWGNFWRADLSRADGVFVFLIEPHMKRLDKFISSQKPAKSLKLVSHAFKIPGRKPSAKRGAMFLYRY